MSYPDRHHPVFFLEDSLKGMGVEAAFHRGERTLGCWGLIIRDTPFVWLVDNRWPHEREREDPAARQLMAQGAMVCCAQKPDADRLGARWLPLAATPGYAVAEKERLFDVGFVGYVRDEQRAGILADVGARFTLSAAQGVFGDSAVDTYHAARAGLNVPTYYGNPLAYDVNMRVFEVAATGTPLVTNWLPDLEALGFADGHTCYIYRHRDEAVDAIQKALANPSVGKTAAELVKARHTYDWRAREVMRWIDGQG